jgi:hypothetical protein
MFLNFVKVSSTTVWPPTRKLVNSITLVAIILITATIPDEP